MIRADRAANARNTAPTRMPAEDPRSWVVRVGRDQAGHPRGSHGCNGVTAGVGAWNAPFDGAVVAVEVDGAVEVDDATGDAVVAVPVDGDDGGGFTVNWVPVTTVTWAPSTVGPRAMITAPESEWATVWAAAMSVAVLWA